MTLSEYNRLVDYWEQEPPTQLLVAGFVGYKPPVPDGEQPNWQNESVEDLIHRWSGAGPALLVLKGTPDALR